MNNPILSDKKGGISFQITPVGEIEGGKRFRISIQVPFEVGWIERMKFLIKNDKEKMAIQLSHKCNQDEVVFFEGYVNLTNHALYFFCFSFEANRIFRYFKKKDLTEPNCICKGEYWKLSVGFSTPDWAKGGNMYHIFVDRFRRKSGDEDMKPMPRRKIHKNWNEAPVLGPDVNGDWNIDFFGGNLQGIEESIKYLKNMGITILYLSPIMESQSNHRYDTGDYEKVDMYAGTNQDLKHLCQVAHKNGMFVILDAVFNHTGNDSKYFNEYGTYDTVGAAQSKESPYWNFYKHHWDGSKEAVSYWWGMTNLPECDGNSKEWKSYILGKGGIIDQWFELGIDGLRADVADELTDEFIFGMREAIHRNKPDGLFIGEVWKNPMRMNRGYLSTGLGMDSVMNYLLIDSLIRYFKYADVGKLKNTFTEILTEYPEDTILTLMNFSSTHDISRAIEIFGCDEFQRFGEWAWNLRDDRLEWVRQHKMTEEQYNYGKKVFETYLFTLTFLPGIMSIFYGDEVGLQGIGNLANRGTYPWGKEDKKLLKFVKKCMKIRKEQVFLKYAELNIILVDSQKMMFERVWENEKIIVVVNRTHEKVNYNLPEEYKNAQVIHLLNANCDYLDAHGAIAFKI